MEEKNIIIGLDGATWEILNSFISMGVLPSIRKIKSNSSYGELRSTVLPITPAAWVSMLTGCSPAKTGIYSFTKSSENQIGYTKSLVCGSDIKVPTFFEILSNLNRDVISVNVPMTFPPKPVQGYVISGMMTPAKQSNYTFPKNLAQELSSHGIEYRIDTKIHLNPRLLNNNQYVDTLYSNGAKIFFDDLNEVLNTRSKTINYLIRTKSWDYFMFVIIGMDRIQHHFWDYIVNPKLDAKIYDNIVNYFTKVDNLIGEIAAEYEGKSNILIVSDHGFTKYCGDILIDKWLYENGFLKIVKSDGKRFANSLKILLKRYGLDVKEILSKLLSERRLERIASSASNIDWKNTLAYCSAINGININMRDREVLGIVLKNDYENLRDRLIEQLENVTDDSGNKIIIKAFKKEELFQVKNGLNFLPDIILSFDESNLHWAFPSDEISRDIPLIRRLPWKKGNHIRGGIIMAQGKNIRKGGFKSVMNIEDFMPTLFAINNEPIPDYVDGVVNKEIFDKNTGIIINSVQSEKKGGKYKFTEDEEKELRKKLKSMGYL